MERGTGGRWMRVAGGYGWQMMRVADGYGWQVMRVADGYGRQMDAGGSYRHKKILVHKGGWLSSHL
ncbi:hypothetical protein [Filimonas effusa]|uniref:Uncharacterized protein n=1 Tax=Filimonas effusa TaxID=2508721 RepID=A0A4Q1D0T5_9BACT|nr:hypothetical protein [Filimonas effusa]RXK81349.1 hypothetical protein ESB13_20655 [Filimonas effusa]